MHILNFENYGELNAINFDTLLDQNIHSETTIIGTARYIRAKKEQ
jgi:hypothetical protein